MQNFVIYCITYLLQVQFSGCHGSEFGLQYFNFYYHVDGGRVRLSLYLCLPQH